MDMPSVPKNGTTELPVSDQMLIALRQITQAIDLRSRYLAKHHGLTGPQLVILKEVNREGEQTVGDLARAISLSQSTVTGILDRLESRGLVVRHRADADKRRVIVDVTEECRRFLETAPPALQEEFLKGFEALPRWEQLMILAALQRLVSLMKAEAIDAGALLATGPLGPENPPAGNGGDSGGPPI
jgi:DNA-binding MarR family transcriptional regulator